MESYLKIKLKDGDLTCQRNDYIYKKSGFLQSQENTDEITLGDFTMQSFNILIKILGFLGSPSESRYVYISTASSEDEDDPMEVTNLPKKLKVSGNYDYVILEDDDFMNIEDFKDAFVLIDILKFDESLTRNIHKYLAKTFFANESIVSLQVLRDNLRPEDLEMLSDFKYWPKPLVFKDNVGYFEKNRYDLYPPDHGETENLEGRRFLVLTNDGCDVFKKDNPEFYTALNFFIDKNNIEEVVAFNYTGRILENLFKMKNIKKIIIKTSTNMKGLPDICHVKELKLSGGQITKSPCGEKSFLNDLVLMEIKKETEDIIETSDYPDSYKLHVKKDFYTLSNENKKLKKLSLSYVGEYVKFRIPYLENLQVVNFQLLDRAKDSEIISKAEKMQHVLCNNLKLTLYIYLKAKSIKPLPFSINDKVLVTFETLNLIKGNLRTMTTDRDHEFIYKLLKYKDEAWDNFNTYFEEEAGIDKPLGDNKKSNVSFLITRNEQQELMIYGPFN